MCTYRTCTVEWGDLTALKLLYLWKSYAVHPTISYTIHYNSFGKVVCRRLNIRWDFLFCYWLRALFSVLFCCRLENTFLLITSGVIKKNKKEIAKCLVIVTSFVSRFCARGIFNFNCDDDVVDEDDNQQQQKRI